MPFDVQNVNPTDKRSRVSKTSLQRIVQMLSFPRCVGTDGNKKALDLIVSECEAMGKKVSVVGDMKNIVIGNLEKAEILVGAHYDSVPDSPGADDNASAVASMIESANYLESDKICFVAFNGEETNLAGSHEFAQNLGDHRLKMVHILEMVGYTSEKQVNPFEGFIEMPEKGNFIGIVGNLPKLSEVQVDIPLMGMEVGDNLPVLMHVAPHIFRSDHSSFWRIGVPAVMWTDTAEFRNHNYHKKTDLPNTLNYEFMASVTEALIQCCENDL